MVSLFSDSLGTGYITVGDEYDKKPPVDPRNAGLRCFVTTGQKSGHGKDAMLDKAFKSIHEGDPYQDPGHQERRGKPDKPFIGNGAFRFPGPGKKSCGLGGYEGCFEQHVVHETEFEVVKKGELPAKKEAEPRNIVTNPCKKGTYGVPGTLLSSAQKEEDPAAWTGAAYISDPVDYPKAAEKARREAEKTMLGDKPPFKVTGTMRSYFDESAYTGSSQVYKLTQPLPPSKPKAETEHPAKDTPWKPVHGTKSGLDGLFGVPDEPAHFPPYREDPYEIKESKEKEERLKDKPKFGNWRPTSTSKSLPTKSVEFGRGFQ